MPWITHAPTQITVRGLLHEGIFAGMRVWTNGDARACLRESTFLFERGDLRLVVATARLEHSLVRGELAVSPDASTAFVGGTSILLGAPYRPVSSSAVVVTYLDNDVVYGVVPAGTTAQIAALVGKPIGRHDLCQSSLAALRGSKDDEARTRAFVPTPLREPTRVTWPEGAGRIWSAEPPWSTKSPGAPGGRTADWTMSSNEFGLVAIDQESGCLVLLSLDGQARVFRIPAEYPEIPTYGAAVGTGFVVVYDGRDDGALLRFDARGSVVAAHSLAGRSSAPAVCGDRLWIAADAARFSSDVSLLAFRASTLEPLGAQPLPLQSTHGNLDLSVGPDGRTFVASDGKDAVIGRASEGGAWAVSRWDFDEKKNAPLSVAPEAPSRTLPRRVKHKNFGEGNVVGEAGEGPIRKFVVEFSGVGRQIVPANLVVVLEK